MLSSKVRFIYITLVIRLMRHAEMQNGTHPLKYRIPIAPHFDLSAFSFCQIFRIVGMRENYYLIPPSFQYTHLKWKSPFYMRVVLKQQQKRLLLNNQE